MGEPAFDMSKDEFKALIEDTVEEKLLEWVGEAEDEGEIASSIRERLLRQKEDTENGERGSTLDEVADRLNLSSS